jgi:hypothetical protein
VEEGRCAGGISAGPRGKIGTRSGSGIIGS